MTLKQRVDICFNVFMPIYDELIDPKKLVKNGSTKLLWKCFNEIIEKSAEDKISFKAVLEVSPRYLIRANNKNVTSKLRVVADACFR